MTQSKLWLVYVCFATAWVCLSVYSGYRVTRLSNPCEMTYSWPVYVELKAPSHPRYRLYSLSMKRARSAHNGIPVLYVPGHLASYKQSRSLGRHLYDIDPSKFDVFSLDFQQEPSALNGNFIRDQSSFLNECIHAIRQLYRDKHRSIFIVAHSMGGIVVRHALTLDSTAENAIESVITISTPHLMSRFPFDTASVYPSIQNNTVQVPFVSLAGGFRDLKIPAAFTRMKRHDGLTILTSLIPSVLVSADHECLVWCHAIVKAIAKGVDQLSSGKTMEESFAPADFTQKRDYYEEITSRGYADHENTLAVWIHPYVQASADYLLIHGAFVVNAILTILTLVLAYQWYQWQTTRQMDSIFQILNRIKLEYLVGLAAMYSYAPFFLTALGVLYLIGIFGRWIRIPAIVLVVALSIYCVFRECSYSITAFLLLVSIKYLVVLLTMQGSSLSHQHYIQSTMALQMASLPGWISSVVYYGVTSSWNQQLVLLCLCLVIDLCHVFHVRRLKLISIEDCSTCVFEDGGKNAIFIEFKTGRFKVVSCFCARDEDFRSEYCAFCKRTCDECCDEPQRPMLYIPILIFSQVILLLPNVPLPYWSTSLSIFLTCAHRIEKALFK